MTLTILPYSLFILSFFYLFFFLSPFVQLQICSFTSSILHTSSSYVKLFCQAALFILEKHTFNENVYIVLSCRIKRRSFLALFVLNYYYYFVVVVAAFDVVFVVIFIIIF